MTITHQLQFISEVQVCFNTWKSSDATHYINRRKARRNDHLRQRRKVSGSIYHQSMETALRKPRTKEEPLVLIKYISRTKTRSPRPLTPCSSVKHWMFFLQHQQEGKPVRSPHVQPALSGKPGQ